MHLQPTVALGLQQPDIAGGLRSLDRLIGQLADLLGLGRLRTATGPQVGHPVGTRSVM